MAMFVHLAPEKLAARIRRDGIAKLRKPFGDFPGGVYAVPVVRSFIVSHQWLRELKRRNLGPILGIYFRIADDERVWIGHYGRNHQQMTASESVAQFETSEDRLGWEVIIPRRIEAKEIHRLRHLPQVVGWRYTPMAKGKPPYCGCKFCTRGLYGAQKMRNRLGWRDD